MNDLRVFISSTFRDLQEEREHLVRKVFPEIRTLCRERGIAFTEVDLRWGLTEEHVVHGQVVRTCLEEIDKCRPYFIGITGDRYGTVPDLVEVYKDAELLARWPWIEDAVMEGSSIIDLEFRHGALNAGNDRARFFFRSTETVETSVPADECARLEELRERVRGAGHAPKTFRDAASLGRLVHDALIEIIERDFANAAPPTELERERASHEAFAASRRHAYIPNPEYLSALNAWLNEADAPPLVLYAESGSGKSALVSFWCQQLRRRSPDAFVVEHYVGIGAGATDHYGIMRHVMSEIKERFARPELIPTKPEELELQFANWLGFGVGAPMIVVLDGINQLTGHALELRWLPPEMPPGIHLIITSTVEQTLVDLRRRGWRELAMQPLTEREREGVIVRYLSEYHKALSRHQLTRIADDTKCAHPLFLRTLLEELRIDSSHEMLDQCIDRYLGTSGTEDLFQRVLQRMESDFGEHSVREVMALIWSSRSGLGEEDLQPLTGVSRLKLSTMLAGLDYHLTRRDGVLTFFHDYLRRAVEKRYLNEERIRTGYWNRLASHFEVQPITLRATRELVHALDRIGEKDRLLATIADVERFMLLFAGHGQYDVYRYWAGVDRATTARIVLHKLAEWRGHANSDRVLPVLETIADLLAELGCVSDAIALGEDRVTLAESVGNLRHQVRAHGAISWLRQNAGDLPGARDHAIRAQAIASQLGDRSVALAASTAVGLIHARSGEFDQALAYFTEDERIARDTGDRHGQASALANQGIVHSTLGDYDGALRCYSEAESIARGIGDRRLAASVVGNRGIIHTYRNQFDDALKCYREAEAIARSLGNRRAIALAVGNRGVAHQGRGEFEEALACYSELEALSRETNNQRAIALALGNRGNIYLERGDYSSAMECFEKMEAIARSGHEPLQLAQAACQFGTAHMRRGEYQQAYARFTEQEIIARGIGEQRQLSNALSGRAGAALELATLERPLPEIQALFPGASLWPECCLRLARELAVESMEIADTMSLPDIAFSGELLLTRIDAAESQPDAARDRLLRLLGSVDDESKQADIHYWLWKLSLDPIADHRAEAERIIAELHARTSMHAHALMLEELRAGKEAPGVED